MISATASWQISSTATVGRRSVVFRGPLEAWEAVAKELDFDPREYEVRGGPIGQRAGRVLVLDDCKTACEVVTQACLGRECMVLTQLPIMKAMIKFKPHLVIVDLNLQDGSLGTSAIEPYATRDQALKVMLLAALSIEKARALEDRYPDWVVVRKGSDHLSIIIDGLMASCPREVTVELSMPAFDILRRRLLDESLASQIQGLEASATGQFLQAWG